MEDLFSQLGINGKSLLAQGVNFSIILVVLTAFVYKPLLKVIEDRNNKIKLGLEGAAEAERRLAQIAEERKSRLREADKEAVAIIGAAEKRAWERGVEIIAQAENKADQVIAEALKIAELKKQEELAKLTENANKLIEDALVKVINLKPEEVDHKLINQAVENLKSQI
jgi:F-type H+-transporting ATPase subunit b